MNIFMIPKFLCPRLFSREKKPPRHSMWISKTAGDAPPQVSLWTSAKVTGFSRWRQSLNMKDTQSMAKKKWRSASKTLDKNRSKFWNQQAQMFHVYRHTWPIHVEKNWGYHRHNPWGYDGILDLENSTGFSPGHPWRIHGAGILMLTSMGCDGIHGTPYISQHHGSVMANGIVTHIPSSSDRRELGGAN